MPTILITGASRGLGLGFARHFAAAGWRVLATCRNPDEATDLAGLAAESGGRITVDALDVDDFDAIAGLGKTLSGTPIDVLLNNAGIMNTPYGLPNDGFETQMGTNHLGHFALTGRLLDVLKGTAGSRVVTVSSSGHRAGTSSRDLRPVL